MFTKSELDRLSLAVYHFLTDMNHTETESMQLESLYKKLESARKRVDSG